MNYNKLLKIKKCKGGYGYKIVYFCMFLYYFCDQDYMDFNCLGKNGINFIKELSVVIPEFIEKGEIEKLQNFNVYTVDIEDNSGKQPLRISYVTYEDVITIGHDIYDHKHFCEDVNGEYFIKESIEYLKKIYKK